jgi:hypothetical protein
MASAGPELEVVDEQRRRERRTPEVERRDLEHSLEGLGGPGAGTAPSRM